MDKNPYWVPEDHMFKSGSDCLDAYPDSGPACMVFKTNLNLALSKLEEGYVGLAKEIRGLISAHEFALRADGGNSNIKVIEIRLKEAKELMPELLSELKTQF